MMMMMMTMMMVMMMMMMMMIMRMATLPQIHITTLGTDRVEKIMPSDVQMRIN